MDPVTLILMTLAKNPQSAADSVNKMNQPGAVNVEVLQESVVDLSRQVLSCYHKTARFRQADVIARPWDRQAQYAAENSMVIRISFQGYAAVNNYQMTVAAMRKGGKVRTAVINENTLIPYNKKCQLEEWTGS